MATKEYLDEERKKLWNEVNSLKEQLTALRVDFNTRTPEHEADAKQSSRKASEYRNRALESKKAADSALSDIRTAKESLELIYSEIVTLNDDVKTTSSTCADARKNIDAANKTITELNNLLVNIDDYESKTEELNEFYRLGSEEIAKIKHLHNSSLEKKSEIDEFHVSIFGYENTDEETGEVKSVKGLRAQLLESFSDLEKNIESSDAKLSEIYEQAEAANADFLSDKDEKLEEKLSEWNVEHDAASKKIKELLPDALTAGLSHAFYEKREAEIQSGKDLNKTFNLAIGALVLVSCIPFAINWYLLNGGKEIEAIIDDLPKMLASILPLYIPLAWLAFTANRKINLSKRLVEEYTHKEVLSKTFEGLSSQIEGVNDKEISAELRIKLLYNLMDVSAENPGKLISNYDNADHPLMEVLDASSRLDAKVKKLEKIPGMSKVSKLLDDRAKRLKKQQTEAIDTALEVVKEADD